VEGKVKVQSLNSQGNSDVMTPGQQIQLEKNGQMKLIRDADVSEEVAWKNGLFVFHNDDLPAIMRRLARWYKVEVAYKNSKVPVSHFTGAIRRQENISKVLNMLELTGGANFDIEGRTIIVSE
jgi:ferric-dicitrate binding protein FerR (iron transport regulator)